MSKIELERKVLYLYDLYYSGYMANGLGDTDRARKVKEELDKTLEELERREYGIR